MKRQKGFSLIELVIVIIVLGTLAVVAAPRFLNLARDARIAGLNSLSSQMQSSIDLVKAKARVEGLRPFASNPSGSGGNQTDLLLDFGFGSVEVDWRNLCPESRGELGDDLNFPQFLQLSDEFESRFDNQYTLIGYDVPASGTPTNEGCYVLYDSFGSPDCTLEVITTDC